MVQPAGTGSPRAGGRSGDDCVGNFIVGSVKIRGKGHVARGMLQGACW